MQPCNLYNVQVKKSFDDVHDKAFQQHECKEIDNDDDVGANIEPLNQVDMEEMLIHENAHNWNEVEDTTYNFDDEHEFKDDQEALLDDIREEH